MQDHHHYQHQQTVAGVFPQLDNNVQFPEQEQLKCPRCDSNNTKFCYYNNYNLSQPRHFCKNCKRYWTKGGTLRNIPVGGGCRKSTKRPAASSKQHLHRQEVQNPSAPPATPLLPQPVAVAAVLNGSPSPAPKDEPGPAQTLGAGPGSSGGVGESESFTSLLGLASKGQFGNFNEGFGQSGPGQGSGSDSVRGTGSPSSEGFMISEGNCWVNYNNNSNNNNYYINNGWPDLVINANPGSKLQ